MDFDQIFRTQLDALKAEGNYRTFAELERKRGEFPRAANHKDGAVKDITVWCSNDYLGMGQRPAVVKAMVDCIHESGTGAGGTRNISGNNHKHLLLEAELADLHRKEAALLFTSGYVSNWAALSTLGSRIPNVVILSDAGNHASMIEGVRHSRADKVIWDHDDWRDLDRKLAAVGGYITGTAAMCDFIRSFASGFIFTTALPPAVVAAATASIQHLKSSTVERDRQKQQVAKLRAKLDRLGIPHMANESHIVPVLIGDPVKCRMISDILMRDWNIYVQPINYPTVAKGTERLRITPSPFHSDADIDHLANALHSLWQHCALSRAVAWLSKM
jgi:7-keto-8-aminopelargonate synthetase-like enzyme